MKIMLIDNPFEHGTNSNDIESFINGRLEEIKDCFVIDIRFVESPIQSYIAIFYTERVEYAKK